MFSLNFTREETNSSLCMIFFKKEFGRVFWVFHCMNAPQMIFPMTQFRHGRQSIFFPVIFFSMVSSHMNLILLDDIRLKGLFDLSSDVLRSIYLSILKFINERNTCIPMHLLFNDLLLALVCKWPEAFGQFRFFVWVLHQINQEPLLTYHSMDFWIFNHK